MRLKSMMVIVFAVSCLLVSGVASAATTPDVLKVASFEAANTSGATDASVLIFNAGTSGGSLCANIYVFDNTEELKECCSCAVSIWGEIRLSVDSDLTFNPGDGTVPTRGEIVVLSTTNAICAITDAAKVPPATAGLRVEGVRIDPVIFTTSTSEFQDAMLGTNAQRGLANLCLSIEKVDSGKGICSCGH